MLSRPLDFDNRGVRLPATARYSPVSDSRHILKILPPPSRHVVFENNNNQGRCATYKMKSVISISHHGLSLHTVQIFLYRFERCVKRLLQQPIITVGIKPVPISTLFALCDHHSSSVSSSLMITSRILCVVVPRTYTPYPNRYAPPLRGTTVKPSRAVLGNLVSVQFCPVTPGDIVLEVRYAKRQQRQALWARSRGAWP